MASGKRGHLAAAIAILAGLSAAPAFAGSATSSVGASLTLGAACTVTASAPAAFATGSSGMLTSALTANGSVSVECSNTTPYNIELGPGTASGATVATRALTGPGGATISYGFYRNSGLTQNWGQTDGSDTVSGTGTGSAVAATIYGEVPTQTTPAPGYYADTVAITVKF